MCSAVQILFWTVRTLKNFIPSVLLCGKNILQRKMFFCSAWYHPKHSNTQTKINIWVTWISATTLSSIYHLWVCASYTIIMACYTKQVKQRSSRDNSIMPSMVCMPWAALYKYTILTCAMILFAPKDWSLQTKGFNKWHDTLYLPGKQNHLQQDEAMAMLKLTGMLFQ